MTASNTQIDPARTLLLPILPFFHYLRFSIGSSSALCRNAPIFTPLIYFDVYEISC